MLWHVPFTLNGFGPNWDKKRKPFFSSKAAYLPPLFADLFLENPFAYEKLNKIPNCFYQKEFGHTNIFNFKDYA